MGYVYVFNSVEEWTTKEKQAQLDDRESLFALDGHQ
jgi:hypothetical protein